MVIERGGVSKKKNRDVKQGRSGTQAEAQKNRAARVAETEVRQKRIKTQHNTEQKDKI